MNLKLNSLSLARPLVVLDLESTGTDPSRDRVVEVAAVKLHPFAGRGCAATAVEPARDRRVTAMSSLFFGNEG